MNKVKKIVSAIAALALFGLTINVASSEKKEKSMLGYVLSPFAWTGQKIGAGYQAFTSWREIKTEIEKRKQEIKEIIEDANDFDELSKKEKEAKKIIDDSFKQFEVEKIKKEIEKKLLEELKEFSTNRALEIIKEKQKEVNLYVEFIQETLQEAKENAEKRKKDEGIAKHKGIDITEYNKTIKDSFYAIKKNILQKIKDFYKKPSVNSIAKISVENIEKKINSLEGIIYQKLDALKHGNIISEEELGKYLEIQKREKTVEEFRDFFGKKNDSPSRTTLKQEDFIKLQNQIAESAEKIFNTKPFDTKLYKKTQDLLEKVKKHIFLLPDTRKKPGK